MGIFDFLAKKGPKGQSVPVTQYSPDRVQEEYRRLEAAGKPHPPNLLVQMGDMYRDAGATEKAIEFYERAAVGFAREERWSMAEATARRVERLANGPTPRSLLVMFEVNLGRRLVPAASAVLERLAKSIRPSESDIIEGVIDVIDRSAVQDPALEIAVAEFLTAVGRPEWSVGRLQIGLRIAKAQGNMELAGTIERKLGDLDPVGGSLESDDWEPTWRPASPRPSERTHALPQEHARVVSLVENQTARPSVQTPSASDVSGASKEAVRLDAVDTRRDGYGDSQIVGELVRQLRAGLEDRVPDDDADAHYTVGLAFIDMGFYQDAADELRKAFNHPDYRLRTAEALAHALVESGQYDHAIEVVDMTLPLVHDPQSRAGLWYWKARAFELAGDRTRAIDLYRQIASIAPRHRDVTARLAMMP